MENSREIYNFADYLKCAKNLSDKTLDAYVSDLKSFFAFCRENGGGFAADSPEAVYAYVSALISEGKKGTTVKRHLSSLKQYYRYAFRDNPEADPMRRTEFRIKTERLLPKTLSVYEIRRLLCSVSERGLCVGSPFAQFQAARDLALIDLIISTGVRIGEAAAARLGDLDLRSRILLIHGKGRKERIIYLSCPETVDNLKNWLKTRKTLSPPNDRLFVNRNLAPLSTHAIEDIFGKYKKMSGINPKATPHYLRHTFATNLLANGSDIRTVQEILGHSSISVTERYTEVTPNRKIAVLKKFNYRNKLMR